MRLERMGGLNARILGGPDGQGGGDGPAVVLLHGFGAPGDDLVGLAGFLAVDPSVRLVFPEAPHVLGPAMPGMVARAWWMIDFSGREAALAAGQPIDLANEDPPGVAEARAEVCRFLDALDASLAPSKLVLGGFSQGAMLSLEVALETDRAFAALLLLSSAFLAEGRWRSKMPGRAGLPVFQTHGGQDPLLAFAAAERLHEALHGAGLDARFTQFRGGHEISRDVLTEARGFLTEVL